MVVNLKFSALDAVKYILDRVKTNPDKIINEIKIIPYSDTWLIQQFSDDQKMLILDGELGEGVKNNYYVEAFINAVKRGKRIDLVCGPKILIGDSGKNELFDYLSWKENKFPNLKMYGVSEENILPKHFLANGRNALIEAVHFPSDVRGNKYTLENSLEWYHKIPLIFKNILKEGTISIKNLERLTFDQMKEWEQSPEFGKQRKSIEIVNANNPLRA